MTLMEGLNAIVCVSISLKRVPNDGRRADKASIDLSESEDRVDGAEGPIESAGVMKPGDDADKLAVAAGVSDFERGPCIV